MFKLSAKFVFFVMSTGIFCRLTMGAHSCKQEPQGYRNLKDDRIEINQEENEEDVAAKDESKPEDLHEFEKHVDEYQEETDEHREDANECREDEIFEEDDDKDEDEEKNENFEDEEEEDDDEEKAYKDQNINTDEVKARESKRYIKSIIIDFSTTENDSSFNEDRPTSSIRARSDPYETFDMYEDLKKRFIEIEEKNDLLRERITNRKNKEERELKTLHPSTDEFPDFHRYERSENEDQCLGRFCPPTSRHFYQYNRQRSLAADDSRRNRFSLRPQKLGY